MAKSIKPKNRKTIWAFGKCIEFNIVTSSISLKDSDIKTGAGNKPVLKDKNKIVLHATASNANAEQVISNWGTSSKNASAHYVVERSADAQTTRGGKLPGVDVQDTDGVDAVRTIDERAVTFHAGKLNGSSVGIETINVAQGWNLSSTTYEPTLRNTSNPTQGSKHCETPKRDCKYKIKVKANDGTLVIKCNCRRPKDENQYYEQRKSLCFQAFEDAQYRTLILLLRHLCIAHTIPRQFLGKTASETLAHWWYNGATGSNAKKKQGKHRRVPRPVVPSKRA